MTKKLEPRTHGMLPQKAFLETLPRKRMAAGCLLFDSGGCILLVRPTYKPVWEIPGGVVELDESPKQCCRRELQEELGLERQVGDLLVVDYNSPADEKTESLMFIFHGGILSEAEIESIRLPEDEISGFAFFDVETLPPEMNETLRERVRMAWNQVSVGSGIYLENQKAV